MMMARALGAISAIALTATIATTIADAYAQGETPSRIRRGQLIRQWQLDDGAQAQHGSHGARGLGGAN